MSRTKWIILVACLLSMGAGVALGMLRSRIQPRGVDARSTWLTQELDLSPSQQQEMEKIWNELLQTRGREFGEQMRTLQQEREVEVAGLLDANQTTKYEQINQRFGERMRELFQKVEQDFLAASEKTRAMLNESQRERYDQLVARFRGMHAKGEWMGMGGPMPARGMMGRGPVSRPSETNQ